MVVLVVPAIGGSVLCAEVSNSTGRIDPRNILWAGGDLASQQGGCHSMGLRRLGRPLMSGARREALLGRGGGAQEGARWENSGVNEEARDS